jgi:hypothetical protein
LTNSEIEQLQRNKRALSDYAPVAVTVGRQVGRNDIPPKICIHALPRHKALRDRQETGIDLRRASRQRREWVAPAGEHWAYVRPEYLTNAFYDAREASGHYAHLGPEERPTFHEIRGLGARLYRDKGVAATEIQLTLTHADEKTTAIYLNGGAKPLRDETSTSRSSMRRCRSRKWWAKSSLKRV